MNRAKRVLLGLLTAVVWLLFPLLAVGVGYGTFVLPAKRDNRVVSGFVAEQEQMSAHRRRFLCYRLNSVLPAPHGSDCADTQDCIADSSAVHSLRLKRTASFRTLVSRRLVSRASRARLSAPAAFSGTLDHRSVSIVHCR